MLSVAVRKKSVCYFKKPLLSLLTSDLLFNGLTETDPGAVKLNINP